MIGDFVTFGVKLLGQPIVVPLVSYVKSTADRTPVGVLSVLEKLVVKSGAKRECGG